MTSISCWEFGHLPKVMRRVGAVSRWVRQRTHFAPARARRSHHGARHADGSARGLPRLCAPDDCALPRAQHPARFVTDSTTARIGLSVARLSCLCRGLSGESVVFVRPERHFADDRTPADRNRSRRRRRFDHYAVRECPVRRASGLDTVDRRSRAGGIVAPQPTDRRCRRRIRSRRRRRCAW
jgi:hypothetical protein